MAMLQFGAARRAVRTGATATILLAGAATAAAQHLPGDPAQGRALAERVCAECHGVEGGHIYSPVAEAPSFQAIANQPETTALSLRAFLRTPHEGMPDLILTEHETDDLSAYILGLR